MSIANPHLEKNLANRSSVSPEAAKLRRRATMMSVSVASVLIVAKLMAYVQTESVSILSSLLDSTLDGVISLIMLFSVRAAMTPADSDHRFGHGKVEPLASLGQAFFIGASAFFLMFEAFARLANPEPVNAPRLGVAVMVLSIVLTLVLIAYQSYVVKKTNSVGIASDRLHYEGDLLMNIGVIAALFLTEWTGFTFFDPCFAIVVAVMLISSAWKIGMESSSYLMDKELPEADREKIETLVTLHPEVFSIHDLRTRSSGVRTFIEFHLEMDGNMTLGEAHDVTEEIEMSLYDAFPTAEVMIHQEPAGIDDDRLDDRIDEDY
jgi:ferrous-iron efflux pump FieF